MNFFSAKDPCDECPSHQLGECNGKSPVRLSSYKPGQKGKIVQICGNGDLRLRMMEMGFVKGAEIEVVKYAPLTDPIEFLIKGYHVCLRRDQAAEILMNEPEKAA
ncbi:MAG: FeoA family protein [Thermodesulfobacteriota bacterium]